MPMPIRLASLPGHLPQAAVNALQRSIGGLRLPAITTAKAGSLQMALAHPVYDMSAADVVAGRRLDAAVLTAWRQLIEHEGVPSVTVELPAGAPSDRFTVVEGPFVAGLAAAVTRAVGHVGSEGSFELRVLRVSALYAELLWLSSRSEAHHDVLLPIAPAPPPLDPGKTYGADDALAALRETAAHRTLNERPAP